jgi:hypothetical protein
MPNDRTWRIDGDTATYDLDEKHFFSIERTDKGFSLKVYDRTEVRGKMVLLYTRIITNSQLGYLIPKEMT